MRSGSNSRVSSSARNSRLCLTMPLTSPVAGAGAKVAAARSSAAVVSAKTSTSSVNDASSESTFSNRFSRPRSIAVGGVNEKTPLPRNAAATVRPPTGVSR